MAGSRSDLPPVRSTMPVNPPGTMSISKPLWARAYLVAQTNGLIVAPVRNCRSYSVIRLSLAMSVFLFSLRHAAFPASSYDFVK